MGKIPYCGKEMHQPRRNGRWSPDRIETARKLAEAGLTKAQAAAAVGATKHELLNAMARARRKQAEGASA